MHQELDPEAFTAQRQAELRDLAEYRARHLREIMRWSDPVFRAQRKADAEHALLEARKIYETMEKRKDEDAQRWANLVRLRVLPPARRSRWKWLKKLFRLA